jgi:hypothetical protein
MRAVHDRELARCHHRAQREPARQPPGLLDADVAPLVVARDDMQVGMRAGLRARAMTARSTGIVARTLAQQQAREGVRHGPLADAVRPVQQVRVRHAATARTDQPAHAVGMADDVPKSHRASRHVSARRCTSCCVSSIDRVESMMQ